MSEVVLDASALLALLVGETGADVVGPAVPGAAISAINLSEVVGKLADRGMPEAAIREAIGALALSVDTFGAEAAFSTGMMRPMTKAAGLSLGDRACLVLASRLGVPALTADRAWAELDCGAEVQVIR